MPDIQDSQGATLLFNGVELGTYVSMLPSWQTGNVHETTSAISPVLGRGTDARVLRQYNVSAMEPGQVQVRFLGNPTLSLNQIGVTGTLAIVWPGGYYSGAGFAIDLNGDIKAGELIQWTMTFQFSGYF
jgi:hypothetical protein